MCKLLVQAIALSGLLALPLGAQTAPLTPLDRGARAQSLQDLRTDIAWHATLCVMNASEISVNGQPRTLAGTAEETGVDLSQMQAAANARQVEHDIAVAVLRAGGEPLRDPPEPFLSLLRQTQADCQDFDRSLRVLDAAIARGNLPETAPAPAPAVLRGTIDPYPFDRNRMFRMEFVLRAVDDVLAADQFVAETLVVARAISGRETLNLEDIAGIETREERRWIAAELLLPDPDTITDLTLAEAQEVLQRINADPDGRFLRYYASLLVANRDRLGDGILTGPDGGGVFYFVQTATSTCRRIADSAALRCVSP